MTVLQIHNDYIEKGGETAAVVQITDILVRNNIKVVHYSRSNHEIEHYGIIQKLIVGFDSIIGIRSFFDIAKILEKERIDYAIVHNTTPLIGNIFYLILHNKGVKIIKYIHNHNAYCLNGLCNRDKGDCEYCQKHRFFGVIKRCYRNNLFASLSRYFCLGVYNHFVKEKIDVFISISHYMTQLHVAKGIQGSKIVTIYHSENTKTDQYCFDDYFLFLGRLTEEKGVRTLLNAFIKNKNTNLVILGDGPLRGVVEQVARENVNISYMGYQTGNEKNSVISHARACIIPSEWDEPFGKTIIESYSYGTPVIGAAVGSISELIRAGSTGYLFERGNVTELLNCINQIDQLNTEQYLLLRNNCIEYSKMQFSEKHYVDQIIKLFSRLRE